MVQTFGGRAMLLVAVMWSGGWGAASVSGPDLVPSQPGQSFGAIARSVAARVLFAVMPRSAFAASQCKRFCRSRYPNPRAGGRTARRTAKENRRFCRFVCGACRDTGRTACTVPAADLLEPPITYCSCGVDGCCPADRCGEDGQCCAEGTIRCGGGCCAADRCCNGTCCAPNVACDQESGRCATCPAGTTRCLDFCCESNQDCVLGICVTKCAAGSSRCGSTGCCGGNQVCRAGQCQDQCPAGATACDVSQLGAGIVCCGDPVTIYVHTPVCCSGAEAGGCFPEGAVCCPNGQSCPKTHYCTPLPGGFPTYGCNALGE